MKRILLTAVSAALLGTAVIQAGSPSTGNGSAEATFRQMQRFAQDASSAADRLQRAAEFRTLGKATHEMLLNQISGDINQMAKGLSQLEAAKSTLSASEKRAYGEVTPVLQDAALNTTRAINALNRNEVTRPTANYLATSKKLGQDLNQAANLLENQLRLQSEK